MTQSCTRSRRHSCTEYFISLLQCLWKKDIFKTYVYIIYMIYDILYTYISLSHLTTSADQGEENLIRRVSDGECWCPASRLQSHLKCGFSPACRNLLGFVPADYDDEIQNMAFLQCPQSCAQWPCPSWWQSNTYSSNLRAHWVHS